MLTGSILMDTDVRVTHMLPQSNLDIAGFGDENLSKEMWGIGPRRHVLGCDHRDCGRDYIMYDSS